MKHVVMAIMAHPDDAELRCFGTLCKYQENGFNCVVLIISNGENGISLNEKSRGKKCLHANTRYAESEMAFKNTGIKTKMLNFTDGSISTNMDLIIAIEEQINYYKPEIILTHYPDEFCADHQDHYSVGRATINCATRAESVKKILLCEPQMTMRSKFIPNCYIDITQYFDRKIVALSCHNSQKGRFYLEERYQKTKAFCSF